MLFDRCEESIVNIDDPFSREVLQKSVGSVRTYGIHHQDADITAKNIEIHAEGVRFLLCYEGEEQWVDLSIPGRFSVYNALATAGACISLGLTLKQIADGLAQVRKIAGRLKRSTRQKDSL